MRLAQRFSLFQSLLVAAVLVVSFVSVFQGARWYFLKEIRLSQERQLGSLVLVAQESVLKADDLLMVNYLKFLGRDPAFARAEFLDERRDLKMASGPGIPPDIEVARYEAPVTATNRRVGKVVIEFRRSEDRRRLKESLAQFFPVLGVAAVLALAVGIFAALFMARRLAVPILRLQERTESVKEGRWEDLVEVEGDDELAELSRKFNDMMLQLKELEALKRDFVAGVTHELVSPLNAIRSGVNYLSAGSAGPLTSEQVDYLLIVSNSASQLSDFIGNLLQVSKIEAGKMEAFFEETDVSRELEDARRLFAPQAKERGLDLAVENVVSGRPWVLDRVMFRQVLHNLISNAIKFTPRGGVKVRLAAVKEGLLLEVSDTGIGIDPKHHRLIFEKFYRVLQPADSSNRKGTGLGLTIVRGILDLHGGTVTLESRPGGGSVFQARFPRKAASA